MNQTKVCAFAVCLFYYPLRGTWATYWTIRRSFRTSVLPAHHICQLYDNQYSLNGVHNNGTPDSEGAAPFDELVNFHAGTMAILVSILVSYVPFESCVTFLSAICPAYSSLCAMPFGSLLKNKRLKALTEDDPEYQHGK